MLPLAVLLPEPGLPGLRRRDLRRVVLIAATPLARVANVPSARTAMSWIAIAAAYVAVAKVGLGFASLTKSVTLVWPASGLALAALFALGTGAWPAVALGAFAVNVTTPGVGPLVAAGIAAGNTLEAVAGAELLRRARFDRAMTRIGDVLRLVALAAITSTAVSASLGVAALAAGGLVSASAAPAVWRTWWLGDAMGDLVFAPLLLVVLSTTSALPSRARAAELAAFTIALVVVTLSIFGVAPKIGGFPQTYVVFPLLTWAALRFGVLGTAASNVVVSAISVYATANARGEFVRATLNESLFNLQAFMAVTVITALLLAAAVAERDRAIALRDDFLALASHELATPLTAIELDVASLSRMLARGDAPEEKVKRRAAHTEQQVQRLKGLVVRLLDSSRLAAGRLALDVAPLDLAELARSAAEPFTVELAAAGRALTVDAPEPVRGAWDRARLEGVLTNLLSNAVKFGADSAVRVTVRAEPDFAILRVEDGGPGVDVAARARVFERFERAASSAHHPGVGLGLWIARGLVDAMGGTITLSDADPKGAAFTVKLPRG
ncbi:MAG TPA: MASE1 domain-containing protein [Byssovorax sp.]